MGHLLSRPTFDWAVVGFSLQRFHSWTSLICQVLRFNLECPLLCSRLRTPILPHVVLCAFVTVLHRPFCGRCLVACCRPTCLEVPSPGSQHLPASLHIWNPMRPKGANRRSTISKLSFLKGNRPRALARKSVTSDNPCALILAFSMIGHEKSKA